MANDPDSTFCRTCFKSDCLLEGVAERLGEFLCVRHGQVTGVSVDNGMADNGRTLQFEAQTNRGLDRGEIAGFLENAAKSLLK
jgi:hypothetical protein